MENRVVITGLGAVTPVGNDVATFWSNIKNGVCGVDELKAFDTTDFDVKIAAEVKDFKPENYIDRKEARRLDRFCHFALQLLKKLLKTLS